MCSETRLSSSSSGLSSNMKTKSKRETRAALIFKFSFTVFARLPNQSKNYYMNLYFQWIQQNVADIVGDRVFLLLFEIWKRRRWWKHIQLEANALRSTGRHTSTTSFKFFMILLINVRMHGLRNFKYKPLGFGLSYDSYHNGPPRDTIFDMPQRSVPLWYKLVKNEKKKLQTSTYSDRQQG